MKEKFEFETLSRDEMLTTNGGILGPVLAVIGVASGACLLAYGAGYIYGKYLCECE